LALGFLHTTTCSIEIFLMLLNADEAVPHFIAATPAVPLPMKGSRILDTQWPMHHFITPIGFWVGWSPRLFVLTHASIPEEADATHGLGKVRPGQLTIGKVGIAVHFIHTSQHDVAGSA
jgi:hypothetical protein